VVDLSLSSLFAIALNFFSPSVGSDEEVIEAVRLVKRGSTNLRKELKTGHQIGEDIEGESAFLLTYFLFFLSISHPIPVGIIPRAIDCFAGTALEYDMLRTAMKSNLMVWYVSSRTFLVFFSYLANKRFRW
jgi:hypothetical protein